MVKFNGTEIADLLPLASTARAEIGCLPSSKPLEAGMTNDQAPLELADAEPTVSPSTKISMEENGSA